MVCATAPQNPFERQAKSRPPLAPPLRDCAVSAAPRSTSLASSTSPRRASRASSGAAASVCCPASSRKTHAHATSVTARRNHPPRHHETRPLQQRWPSHHRSSHRPLQQPSRRLGICSHRHRRSLPRRPCRHLPGSEEGKRDHLTSSPRSPTSRASASPSNAS